MVKSATLETLEIDNILKGYNDFFKVEKIYSELRSNLLGNPVQSSPPDLVSIKKINHSREGSYSWELYKSEFYDVLLEKWGNWKRYANETKENENLYSLKLTFYKDDLGIKKSIEEILKKFPRD